MDSISYLYDDAAAFLVAADKSGVFFCSALLSMLVLLWSANPNATRIRLALGIGAIEALGLAISLLDPSAVLSDWMRYTSVVGAPLVVWCLAREGWTCYLTPWAFSWRRIGAILLGLVVLGYLLVQSVPTHEKNVYWALYSVTQMLAPLVVFKVLLWWSLDALKRVYLIGADKTTRVVDIYFMLWWNHTVRGRMIVQEDWLALTTKYPCFMASSWWQKLGLAFWPDVMEWNAKLGTSNMLWFIEQRMQTPPEILENYSDLKDLW